MKPINLVPGPFAVNAATESCPSPTLTITTRPAGAPVAPTNLHAISDTWTYTHLTWQDNSDNETGFTVQRLNDASDWITVGSVGAGVTGFDDTSVTANTDYTYRVIANGPDDDSTSDDSSSTDNGSDTGTGDGGDDDNIDNGDGLDHDGKADVQSDIAFGGIYSISRDRDGGTFGGITRNWSPENTDPDADPGSLRSEYFDDGETATLTLENLPPHAALNISGIFFDPNGSVQEEIKVDGHTITSAEEASFIEHSGSSVTITDKMTGLQSGVQWYPAFSVGLDSPRIGPPSAVVTVGDTEEYQVTATDPITHGAWRGDLTLSPQIKDGSSVTPIGGNVFIQALSGLGSLFLKGAVIGLSKLLLTDQVSGVKSPTTKELSAAPQFGAPGTHPVIGGKVKERFRVLSADGTKPEKQRQLSVKVESAPFATPNGNIGGTADPSTATVTTNDDGYAVFDVTGKTPGDVWIIVTDTVSGKVNKTLATVGLPTILILGQNAAKHDGDTVFVKAYNAAGDPVAGLGISLIDLGTPPTFFTATLEGTATSADGLIAIGLSVIASGTESIVVGVTGTDYSVTGPITVIKD